MRVGKFWVLVAMWMMESLIVTVRLLHGSRNSLDWISSFAVLMAITVLMIAAFQVRNGLNDISEQENGSKLRVEQALFSLVVFANMAVIVALTWQ